MRACVCHILPCGHDRNYSFCPITFKLHMWVVDDERRNPIDLGSQGQRWRSTLALCVSDIVHTIQTTVFAQSLSNFTCKLSVMRGGTLLIMGHGIKGQGQLWHSVYMTLQSWYRLQFMPNQTLPVVDDERRKPIDFGSQGQRSMSTLAFCV